MSNTILELVGLAAGVAALVCFVIAAWCVDPTLGVSVLGAALTVVCITLVVIANTRKAVRPKAVA